MTGGVTGYGGKTFEDDETVLLLKHCAEAGSGPGVGGVVVIKGVLVAETCQHPGTAKKRKEKQRRGYILLPSVSLRFLPSDITIPIEEAVFGGDEERLADEMLLADESTTAGEELVRGGAISVSCAWCFERDLCDPVTLRDDDLDDPLPIDSDRRIRRLSPPSCRSSIDTPPMGRLPPSGETLDVLSCL
jgi:hypothetical protein